MKTLWKYSLRDVVTHVRMPIGARLIHVEAQRRRGTLTNDVQVWAEVDTTHDVELRKIVLVGTGTEIPERATYIGTALVGDYVFHVYEVTL